MAIDFEHCWEKLRDFFPELDWANSPSDKEGREYVIRNNDKDRLRIKLGKTENGISCKILILQGVQGNKAECTRKMLSKIDIPNYLSFYHGGNAKKVCDICKNATDIKVINGKPIHIGFIHSIDMTEEFVPYGEDNTVKQELKTRIEKLMEFIKIFVDANKKSTTTTNNNTNNNYFLNHEKEKAENTISLPTEIIEHTMDDPTHWGLYFKSKEGEKAIKEYAVQVHLKELNEIGEYEVAYRPNFPDKGPEYFLGMKDTDYEPGKRHPRLNKELPINSRITLKQLACWPMRVASGGKKDIYKHVPSKMGNKSYFLPKFVSYPEYKMIVHGKQEDFHFPDGSGVSKPILHPQVILLGKNWSSTGNAGELEAMWSNAYCAQADVLLDSILAGGYFTDFIKCFMATKYGKNDKNYIRTCKPIPGRQDTWIDVYINIFIQELWLLNDKFKNYANGPHYIIMWGKGIYDLLNDLNFEKLFKEKCKKCGLPMYDIFVFGNHYSNVKPFPDDSNYDGPAKRTCRRVYRVTKNYEESGMCKDRKEDLRRYEFALLEDDSGKLRAYRGNPNK